MGHFHISNISEWIISLVGCIHTPKAPHPNGNPACQKIHLLSHQPLKILAGCCWSLVPLLGMVLQKDESSATSVRFDFCVVWLHAEFQPHFPSFSSGSQYQMVKMRVPSVHAAENIYNSTSCQFKVFSETSAVILPVPIQKWWEQSVVVSHRCRCGRCVSTKA